jgi:hypothetical protein
VTDTGPAKCFVCGRRIRTEPVRVPGPGGGVRHRGCFPGKLARIYRKAFEAVKADRENT